MTATEFETLALQWISVIVPVGIAGATAYYKIKAYVDQLHAQNAGRIDQHDALAGVTTEQNGAVGMTSFRPSEQELSDAVDKVRANMQGTGPVNPAPDPKSFRQPLGQPQKPSA